MNNVCPDDTRLLDFALSPLKEENVDIALHLLHCGECSRKLQLANRIMTLKCEPTDEELTEIRRFRPHAAPRAEDPWEKVESLLNPFDFSSLADFDAEVRPAAAAAVKAPAPRRTTLKTAADRWVNLTFRADCGENSPDFWQAVLRLDLFADGGETLPIRVTDRNREPIACGEFTVTGQRLPVAAGEAAITLERFRGGLRSREVAFRFDSGKVVTGSLIFALEEIK